MSAWSLLEPCKLNVLCSLGDVQPDETHPFCDAELESEEPELVFEFHHRSVAMLQALGIIPRPKCETPLVIDLEDEGDQPPPKRQKIGCDEGLLRTMQVRWLVCYSCIT